MTIPSSSVTWFVLDPVPMIPSTSAFSKQSFPSLPTHPTHSAKRRASPIGCSQWSPYVKVFRSRFSTRAWGQRCCYVVISSDVRKGILHMFDVKGRSENLNIDPNKLVLSRHAKSVQTQYKRPYQMGTWGCQVPNAIDATDSWLISFVTSIYNQHREAPFLP